MVKTVSAYDFSTVMDDLLARQKIQGPYAAVITATTRECGMALLAMPDIRYMPAFKILDMITAMIAIAAAIAQASQLRGAEVRVLLRESFSNETKLMRQFMLEAALERARYEPLMLDASETTASSERQRILQQRWASMRATHHEKAPLPQPWLEAVDQAVAHAFSAPAFTQFRPGPLLQMIAEMLALTRKMHQQNASLANLNEALSPQGVLWRRYALKASRYREATVTSLDVSALQAAHTIH